MQVSTTFGNPLPDRSAGFMNSTDAFRILVLADLGGQKSWGNPVMVDRDNLEDVMLRMNVCLSLGDNPVLPNVEILLKELDDFHPDRLFESLRVFES